MKKVALLRKKVQEIDSVYKRVENLRDEILNILAEKQNLEREIIRLFRKCKHVDSIETEDRVYRVEKRVERDKREKIIEHLSHHLSENGAEASQLNDIHQWKKKMFRAKKKRTLIVLRKV